MQTSTNSMTFDDIMHGFIAAQAAGIKRGDYTAGLDYMDAVNDTLQRELRNPPQNPQTYDDMGRAL